MEPKIVMRTKGYLRILLKSDSPERFLNICSSREIYLWDLQETKEGCECCISIRDFRRLRPIVRKTKIKLIIRNRYGIPFFLHKHRRQKMFFAGIVIFFALLRLCSLFIWDIHIEGNFSYSEDVLLDFLKEQEVSHGMKKSQISCDSIEKSLRNAYNDITWVSASISGTRLIIRIQENYDALISVDIDEKPSDIVAEQDGIIVSIVTRSGTPLVKKGDVVAKGDVLISSDIAVTDDYGNALRHEYIAADGDITAEIVIDYKETIPLVYQKKIFTGQQKEAKAITIFGKRFYLYAMKAPFAMFDIISEQYPLSIGTNFYLPISWERWYYREYMIEEGIFSEEEAIFYLQKNVNNFFQNLLEKGVQIVGNNVKISIDENSATASGKVIIQKPVGVRKNLEWMAEETLDEYNRSDD